jgi:predicted enzyme related to lactoylglutathione lyase
MPTRLRYVMKFVADMDQAVEFHRDTLGLTLKFQSPEWSEFATGDTRLALHPASRKNPAGKVELGFSVPDIQAFFREMVGKGIQFTQTPMLEHGSWLARFVDIEGNECSVGQE